MAMIIDIDDIHNSLNQQMEFSQMIEVEFEGKDCEVETNLVLHDIDEQILVNGSIKTSIELECDRCLKSFVYDIEAKVEEIFYKNKYTDSYDDDTQISLESLAEDLEGKKELDISELLYQYIVLNIPNKKVCDINCKGSEELQQILNEPKIDPRLQVFKDLSEKETRK